MQRSAERYAYKIYQVRRERYVTASQPVGGVRTRGQKQLEGLTLFSRRAKTKKKCGIGNNADYGVSKVGRGLDGCIESIGVQ